LRHLVLVLVLVQVLSPHLCYAADWPCPFSRYLQLSSPQMTGNDVTILQNLLGRSPFVKALTVTGSFDTATSDALTAFQKGNALQPDGILGPASGQVLLNLHMSDGYKDDGKILPGYMYKVHIQVSQNRSLETTANLYDSKMTLIFQFRVRLHGVPGHNQFCKNGDTPSGLSLFDLNSPEDDPKDFGPYPVNRVVAGLKGNAKILLSNSVDTIRSGILLHTGEWDNWQPPQPMPNSDGCIHTWPQFCESVWNHLVALGVTVNENTGGKLPYPYTPQGIISIEEVN